MNPPTLLPVGLAFAEAPRWHRGELWFSDFFLDQMQRIGVLCPGRG